MLINTMKIKKNNKEIWPSLLDNGTTTVPLKNRIKSNCPHQTLVVGEHTIINNQIWS